jgi:hypothetical protein
VLITKSLGDIISPAILQYIELDSDSGESKENKALIASDDFILTDSKFLETFDDDDDDDNDDVDGGHGGHGDELSVHPKIPCPLGSVFEHPDTTEVHAAIEENTLSCLIFSDNFSDPSDGIGVICRRGPGSIIGVEDDFQCIESDELGTAEFLHTLICDREIINVKDKIVHSAYLSPYPGLTLECISQKESVCFTVNLLARREQNVLCLRNLHHLLSKIMSIYLIQIKRSEMKRAIVIVRHQLVDIVTAMQ